MGGGSARDQGAPDATILTSAVAPSAPETSGDHLSDEATIRNAVSAADLETMAGAPLQWANVETGSRGAINALDEVRDGSNLCRSFTASRESFDGVAMYKGQACMVAPGLWRMEKFRPL